MIRVATRRRKARSWVTNSSVAAALDEKLLHPLDRVDVEMVRRLVEEQHVGLAHQRAREQRLALPSARRGRERRRRRSRPRCDEHRVDARLHLPRVGGVERVVQAIELAQRGVAPLARDAMARLVVAREQAPGVAKPGGYDVEDRSVDVVRDLLLELGDGDSGLTDDLTRVGLHRAVEQPHERALPRPVSAEQADALAALDAEARRDRARAAHRRRC